MPAPKPPGTPFAKALRRVVDRFAPGQSVAEVCRRIGAYHNTMLRFLEGKQLPRRENVLHLARALGATKAEEGLLLALAGHRTLDDPRFVAVETWLYALPPERQGEVLDAIAARLGKGKAR